MKESYTTLTRGQLETTLNAGPPENGKRDEGYALVNVLAREQYEREHIPGSINIPREQLDEFDRHFDKEKKIVVYCASEECPASNQAAQALSERGFRHVYDYEGGMSDWREAGNPVETARGT
jgi:rhodanese-related sulfurtransferase